MSGNRGFISELAKKDSESLNSKGFIQFQMLAVIFIVSLFAVSGLMYNFNRGKNVSVTPSPSEEAATATPSPTVSPTLVPSPTQTPAPTIKPTAKPTSQPSALPTTPSNNPPPPPPPVAPPPPPPAAPPPPPPPPQPTPQDIKPFCYDPHGVPSSTGTAPFNVMLSTGGGSGTYGHIAGYQWDYNGDGTWDTGSNASSTSGYVYQTPGTYTVKARLYTSTGEVSPECSGTITVN